ncbi:hypothetical protein MK292_08915 [Myxococcota bacterium]|nr:hypothetical protein [Myxococcota bacterium]
MRHRVFEKPDTQDAFTDLLFNALLSFALLFVMAFLSIQEPAAAGQVETNAEVLITVQWPDGHPDDIDTLVEDPRGNLLWYRNRDTGIMHLDRDDRGNFADQISLSGASYETLINQETATIRILAPGEYVVNVFHFQSNRLTPVPVTVKVEKLNPSVTLVSYDTLLLTGMGDEKTAIRFEVDAKGKILDTSKLPKPLLSTAVRVK